MPDDLAAMLAASAARHRHLCPRQVLGVRIGLAGSRTLGLQVPRSDKRLLVILETDGCFADGIQAATSLAVGRRTMRIVDFGKIAATFTDTVTGRALRISPRPEIRRTAWEYAPTERSWYKAQLRGYQVMPEESLLRFQMVQLKTPLAALISRPGLRVNCSICGEEIINEREVHQDGLTLCRACAGEAYYIPCLPMKTIPA